MATPTTVAEYRKGKTKVFPCSSGHTFEIRKMAIPVLMDMYKELGLEVPEGTPIDKIEEMMKQKVNEPGYTEKIIKAIIKVLPRTIISPKVTTDGSNDSLSIDDIDPGDMFELYVEIIDFSGISEMADKLREKFRDKLNRPNGR